MDRQHVANTLLSPADWVLGQIMGAVRDRDAMDGLSDASYHTLRFALRKQFELINELTVSGVENIPEDGGVILACNHQSWLDVQVLGVGCPRRVHFVAKEEFRSWPVLRHLIELSQSVFVKRGGDSEGLGTIKQALRSGKVVAIFPEGTIPGEEDVRRCAVDRETGLLKGKTGAVRLALEAGVPIVPVGVSGTGRAFPPEVYPRLELLRAPGASPVQIRFGEPMCLKELWGKEQSKEQLRELTTELMRRISKLVDHRSNYVPIEVPIPPPQTYGKVGVLLLHGFTSSTDAVDGLLPYLEEAGIPYERPVLRGHGSRYQNLRGITARDWYVDADRALLKLWNRVDRVVVVGLSMGGLVSLELAMRHPDKIAGVVPVAAALKFKDPLSVLTPAISKVVRYWPSPESFNEPTRAQKCTNYPMFPTDAFTSLWKYSRYIAEKLPEVHVPIRILQSKADQVVAPQAANIIYEKVSSPLREIVWFERSGHEMMQDMQAEAVFKEIMSFVKQFVRPKKPAKSEAPAAG